MSFNDEHTAETKQAISTSTPLVKWKKCPNLPSEGHKYGIRGVAVEDGVLFFGGDYLLGNIIIIYNTTRNHWLIHVIPGKPPDQVKAYEMVIENTRILLFGGMNKLGILSNKLYEFETSQWRWSELNPRPASNNTLPCPRICHSFTLIGNKVYLYGGRSKDPETNEEHYLDDLFTLDISSPNALAWDKPETVGYSVPALSSHTAVSYTNSKGKSKLIIFGGENELIISGHIYTLDIETMSWDKIILNLNPSLSLPRFSHTAVTIKNRMFVFGGWVALMDDKSPISMTVIGKESTNELLCLNLETMSFEELNIDMNEGNIPRRIVDHCAIATQTKMYVWFGELWYLEVNKPQKCSKIEMFRTSLGTLETRWNREPTADTYILQIQKHKSPANTANPVPSSMIDYSSLPFLTTELAKQINDSDDDDNTNITPENLEFIGSHSMDMTDPNTITAATSDTQINKTTVNFTQTKFPKPRLSRTQSI